jgi:cysteine sulfinate desulfinase/cysteine desulfurase-like protein
MVAGAAFALEVGTGAIRFSLAQSTTGEDIGAAVVMVKEVLAVARREARS